MAAIPYHTGIQPTRICDSPRIVVAPCFLSAQECEHFKELGIKHGMSRAKLVGNTTGVDTTSEARTNVSCWLQHNVTPITQQVVERIANFVGLPLDNAEQIQLIYYQASQYYMAHYDGWAQPGPNEPEAPIGSEAHIVKERYMNGQGGQRMLTTLCYLNTLPGTVAGGETEFPNLRMLEQPTPVMPLDPSQPMPPPKVLKIYPEAGKLVCFSNVYDGTNKLHPNSLHAGCPVNNVIDPATGQTIQAEKWAFNLWFRENKARR
jgi:prolyl 4-hydroxylase